jgi:hypothetical protein
MSKSIALQYYYDNIKNNPEYMEYRRLKKQQWNLDNKQYVSDYYKVYREINDDKIKLNNMVWRLQQQEQKEKQEVAK